MHGWQMGLQTVRQEYRRMGIGKKDKQKENKIKNRDMHKRDNKKGSKRKKIQNSKKLKRQKRKYKTKRKYMLKRKDKKERKTPDKK